MAESESIVYLVDDDASVRKALSRLLKVSGYTVQAFDSAESFVRHPENQASAACLVLDIRMPGVTGLDLQQELRKNGDLMPIIFVTGHGDVPMSVQAMKAGAIDFLPKPIEGQDLLRAVEQALKRAREARRRQAELWDIRRRFDSLTAREREVMQWVVAWLLNKQIAFKLGTVEKTIKVHRARVMDKMDVNSLAELVRLAEKIGLPPEGPDSPR